MKRRLLNPSHPWLRLAAEAKRRVLRSDARLREAYLRAASPRKLQIGGGWRALDGWLNTDLERSAGVMRMDATKPFPFADETFDFVYSEHMIEHVSHRDGGRMLAECLRVLRPGGVLRLVTPDLANILALAGPALSDVQRRYLDYFAREFLREDHPATAVGAINAHFRLWGHSFLYDEPTLADAMARAGFVEIERRALDDSRHPDLAGISNAGRYPEGLLEYESVALEGRKPAGKAGRP